MDDPARAIASAMLEAARAPPSRNHEMSVVPATVNRRSAGGIGKSSGAAPRRYRAFANATRGLIMSRAWYIRAAGSARRGAATASLRDLRNTVVGFHREWAPSS